MNWCIIVLAESCSTCITPLNGHEVGDTCLAVPAGIFSIEQSAANHPLTSYYYVLKTLYNAENNPKPKKHPR